jgi:hypothetical protein
VALATDEAGNDDRIEARKVWLALTQKSVFVRAQTKATIFASRLIKFAALHAAAIIGCLIQLTAAVSTNQIRFRLLEKGNRALRAFRQPVHFVLL